jgi:hypothetical protein
MSFFSGGFNLNNDTPKETAVERAPLSSNILGTPWPDLYGEITLTGTLLAWTGHRVVEQTTSVGKGGGQDVKSGELHYRTFALGLCLGPIDAVRAIWLDAGLLWKGNATVASANGDGYVEISTERGYVRIYFGTAAQNQDAAMAAIISGFPSFRGFAYAVFVDWQIGTSDNLPPLEFVIARAPGGTAKGMGANPIARAYELLTDPIRGVQLPAAFIGDFSAAQAAVETGLSEALTNKSDVREGLEAVLGDVDAALIFSNGQFKPVLLRNKTGDFQLQQDDIEEVERSPADWWERPTQANVKYRDYQRRFRDANVPLFSAGPIVLEDKIVDIDLPRCTDEAAARLLGARKLAFQRSALAVTKVVCNRAACAIEPGDVGAFNAPLYGFSATEMFRVVSAEHIASDKIKLAVVPDIFGSLPVSSEEVGAPEGSGGPGTGGGTGGEEVPISAISVAQVGELPYDLAPNANRVTLFAARPDSDSEGFALYASLDGIDYDLVLANGLYHAGGALVSASWPRYAIDRRAYIELNTTQQDITGFSSQSDVGWFAGNLLVIVGSGINATAYAAKELFRISPGRWRITGLLGPLADTVAAEHAIGSPIFVMQLSPRYSVASLPAWTNGTDVLFKAVPYGVRSSPDLSAIDPLTLPVVSRSLRPYPPTTLLADGRGSLFAPTYTVGNTVRIAFSARTRGAGCGYNNPQGPFDPAIAIEGEFVVRIAVAGTVTRTIIVAADALYTDDRGVTRLYTDYDPADDGNPDAFTVTVNARTGGWESLAAETLEVIKA